MQSVVLPQKSEADTKEIARNDKVECQLIFRSVSHTM